MRLLADLQFNGHPLAWWGASVAPVAGKDAAPLISGLSWASRATDAQEPTTITYAFPQVGECGPYPDGLTAYTDLEAAFREEDMQLTRQVLRAIQAVANVRFVELAPGSAAHAQVVYRYSAAVTRLNFAGYGFYPGEAEAAGDVWIAPEMKAPRYDAYRGHLVLHETLHALGLKHPFVGDAQLGMEQNVIATTVMSYSPLPGARSGHLSAWPATPMVLDILALQHLYGVAPAAAGDTVHDLAAPQFQSGYHALWDSGGYDRLDASGLEQGVEIDLREGHASDVGASVGATDGDTGAQRTDRKTLVMTWGTVIEAATGSRFSDLIVGNGVANALCGGPGNDALLGEDGNDLLHGSLGDDLHDGGPGLDTAIWAAPYSHFAVTGNAAASVVEDLRGADGRDRLQSVERLEFGDLGVALDLDGQAGMVARVMGLVLGRDSLFDRGAVAMGLHIAGSGGAPAVAAASLAAIQGARMSDAALVSQLFTNVFGFAPDELRLADILDRAHTAHLGRSATVLWAAASDEVAQAIDLAGLRETGLFYAIEGMA